MTDLPEFILASRSPRRRDLLADAGYRFRVAPPPLGEPLTAADHPTPAQLAESLAYFKARSVFAANPDSLVLGADTVVARGGEIFGKADDEDEAHRMLAALAGTRHRVITGLALLAPPEYPGGPEQRLLAAATTYVTMRTMTEAELDAYVASGEWRDKAGAYAIQETADAFVEKVEGSFTNVIGLPMELLAELLQRAARHLPGR